MELFVVRFLHLHAPASMQTFLLASTLCKPGLLTGMISSKHCFAAGNNLYLGNIEIGCQQLTSLQSIHRDNGCGYALAGTTEELTGAIS